MGEIGISRREFLYEIDFWEARRIVRGYDRRHRTMWSATRWHAFNIMSAMPYVDMKKAGLNRPSDLIQFPWDSDPEPPVSDDEIDELQDLMKSMRKE